MAPRAPFWSVCFAVTSTGGRAASFVVCVQMLTKSHMRAGIALLAIIAHIWHLRTIVPFESWLSLEIRTLFVVLQSEVIPVDSTDNRELSLGS